MSKNKWEITRSWTGPPIMAAISSILWAVLTSRLLKHSTDCRMHALLCRVRQKIGTSFQGLLWRCSHVRSTHRAASISPLHVDAPFSTGEIMLRISRVRRVKTQSAGNGNGPIDAAGCDLVSPCCKFCKLERKNSQSSDRSASCCDML